MKQKIITIIATLLTILVCVLLIATRGTAKAINPNSEKIAQLTYQISELEYQKMMCLDDLSRNQSKEQMNGFTKYCVEYDEQIMLLQSEIDELSERKAESETETAGTIENEFPFAITSNNKFCEGEIAQELRNIQNGSQSIEGAERLFLNGSCDYEYEWLERAEQSRNADRYPGKLTEDGTQQEMPVVQTTNGSHEAFKELAKAYGLDASQIRAVENHYGIKEGVILCITVAETSGGNRGAGGKNIGSVGSNDRGDRPTYALLESGLEDIGKTLNNKYLGKIQTLGCLSNAGSCQSRDDNGKRYATSDGNRERNMTACLSTIYGKINPAEFSIRR